MNSSALVRSPVKISGVFPTNLSFRPLGMIGARGSGIGGPPPGGPPPGGPPPGGPLPGGPPPCYVFLTYYDCARNGLSLGPSSLLHHTLPSRTDYDSSLIPIVTHY
jgi:hypothetical protein